MRDDLILRELDKQRLAVLQGTYVNHSPTSRDEACLVVRMTRRGRRHLIEAIPYVYRARHSLGYVMPPTEESLVGVGKDIAALVPEMDVMALSMIWSDRYGTVGTVIEILEEAQRLRKEDLVNSSDN